MRSRFVYYHLETSTPEIIMITAAGSGEEDGKFNTYLMATEQRLSENGFLVKLLYLLYI